LASLKSRSTLNIAWLSGIDRTSHSDKLRAIPIPRYSIVLGRLVAEGAKGIVLSSVIVLLALPFGITIASGPAGFVLLVALTALWGVVYAGFMQLVALKTRSAAAVNSGGLIFFPLLFLTPNFVPRFGWSPRWAR
jgi:ABC-2 type transport system permease protein